MARALQAALLAGALAVRSSAYVYHLTHNTGSKTANADGTTTQAALVLSEGPMFASYAAPFGGGPSRITLAYSAVATGGNDPDVAPEVNVHTVYLDSDTKGQAGVRLDNEGGVEYCCTTDLLASNDCGPGVAKGGFIIRSENAARKATVVTVPVKTGDAKPAAGDSTFDVSVEGGQYVILAACDKDGDPDVHLPDVALDITVTFQNPYGYLPGQLYGYLPFYGVLFVAYLLFTIGYSITACVQRAYLLKLQYLILATIAFGTLEMAVFFFMYDSKNKSGVPTPCNVCPTTTDYLVAVVMNVVKRASSRVMLLAVALGFGVVHPSLPRKTSVAVLGLGLAYMLVSVLDSVNRQTSYDIGPSTWEIPVLVLDFLFVGWIYVGLNRIKADLTTTGQQAKLDMYNRLTWVILFNIGGWFVATLIMVGIRMGGLPLPWKSLFIFANFWDLNYLLVLIAIAWIWRPGPFSYQYAYSQQIATSEQDAEGGPDSADFEDVPPPGSFAIQNDDEDEDDEEGGAAAEDEEEEQQPDGTDVTKAKPAAAAAAAPATKGKAAGGSPAKAGGAAATAADGDDAAADKKADKV